MHRRLSRLGPFVAVREAPFVLAIARGRIVDSLALHGIVVVGGWRDDALGDWWKEDGGAKGDRAVDPLNGCSG